MRNNYKKRALKLSIVSLWSVFMLVGIGASEVQASSDSEDEEGIYEVLSSKILNRPDFETMIVDVKKILLGYQNSAFHKNMKQNKYSDLFWFKAMKQGDFDDLTAYSLTFIGIKEFEHPRLSFLEESAAFFYTLLLNDKIMPGTCFRILWDFCENFPGYYALKRTIGFYIATEKKLKESFRSKAFFLALDQFDEEPENLVFLAKNSKKFSFKTRGIMQFKMAKKYLSYSLKGDKLIQKSCGIILENENSSSALHDYALTLSKKVNKKQIDANKNPFAESSFEDFSDEETYFEPEEEKKEEQEYKCTEMETIEKDVDVIMELLAKNEKMKKTEKQSFFSWNKNPQDTGKHPFLKDKIVK